MQKDSKIFDDMARMASSATGAMFDMKREIETSVSSQVEKFLTKMHFVTRDEFEAVKEMAMKARAENEALREEIEALKPSKTVTPKKAAAKKSAAKKTTAK